MSCEGQFLQVIFRLWSSLWVMESRTKKNSNDKSLQVISFMSWGSWHYTASYPLQILTTFVSFSIFPTHALYLAHKTSAGSCFAAFLCFYSSFNMSYEWQILQVFLPLHVSKKLQLSLSVLAIDIFTVLIHGLLHVPVVLLCNHLRNQNPFFNLRGKTVPILRSILSYIPFLRWW